MARFGTLENPFTREYLDFLLSELGFIGVKRYHAINGLIPEDLGGRSVESMTDSPARSSNNLTAVKQGASVLTTLNCDGHTSASISIVSVELIDGDRTLSVKINVTNTGKTTWMQNARWHGRVTVAVRSAVLGSQNYSELGRISLPKDVEPG